MVSFPNILIFATKTKQVIVVSNLWTYEAETFHFCHKCSVLQADKHHHEIFAQKKFTPDSPKAEYKKAVIFLTGQVVSQLSRTMDTFKVSISCPFSPKVSEAPLELFPRTSSTDITTIYNKKCYYTYSGHFGT